MEKEIKITEVNIIPLRPKNGLVALASCVVNNMIYLGSIGIYTKLKGGYRITYPNKKAGKNIINVYHPINKQTGDAIEKAIIDRYEELVNRCI